MTYSGIVCNKVCNNRINSTNLKLNIEKAAKYKSLEGETSYVMVQVIVINQQIFYLISITAMY